MDIKKLRELIADLPDDAQVLIWLNDFDNPLDGEAMDVHDSHVTGTKDSWPDQDKALHIAVLVHNSSDYSQNARQARMAEVHAIMEKTDSREPLKLSKLQYDAVMVALEIAGEI